MVDESPADSAWVPDLRTLHWARDFGQVSAERLAQAMAHDVPLRVDLPVPLNDDVWLAAGDAAYEATWWPLMRAARRMSGLEDHDGSVS